MHTKRTDRGDHIEQKLNNRAIAATVAVLLLGFVAQLLPDSMQLMLRYQRSALENGELWRLLSAHLLHLGWVHWALNTVAVFLLALIFERFWLAHDVLFGGLLLALIVSMALYLFYPGVEWYVGSSGVLHGWFAIASIRMIQAHQPLGWGLLLALGLKIVFERVWGPASSAQWLGGEVIEQAHLWGALAGLLYIALLSGYKLIRTRLTPAE